MAERIEEGGRQVGHGQVAVREVAGAQTQVQMHLDQVSPHYSSGVVHRLDGV